MSRTTRKDIITAFRTEEILKAARTIFAKKGFHETTVDDIARAADVSKGTIYLYYSSKNDIYWAALKDGIRELHEKLKAGIGSVGSVQEKVRTFISVKMEFYQRNHDFFKIYFSEFGNAFSHPVHMQKEFKELYRKQAALLRAVLQQGVNEKSVRGVAPDAAAYAISDLTRCVITHRLLNWSRKDARKDCDFVFDLVWKGIVNS
jgi:AcrR family transcriptional regulator